MNSGNRSHLFMLKADLPLSDKDAGRPKLMNELVGVVLFARLGEHLLHGSLIALDMELESLARSVDQIVIQGICHPFMPGLIEVPVYWEIQSLVLSKSFQNRLQVIATELRVQNHILH